MFRKKAKINSVNFWLAYCVSLASRRHGVYINREEIQKLYPKEKENITFGELNQFLSCDIKKGVAVYSKKHLRKLHGSKDRDGNLLDSHLQV